MAPLAVWTQWAFEVLHRVHALSGMIEFYELLTNAFSHDMMILLVYTLGLYSICWDAIRLRVVRFVAEWFLSMAGFFFFLGRQDFGVEIRVIYFSHVGFHSSNMGSALAVLVKKAVSDMHFRSGVPRSMTASHVGKISAVVI